MGEGQESVPTIFKPLQSSLVFTIAFKDHLDPSDPGFYQATLDTI